MDQCVTTQLNGREFRIPPTMQEDLRVLIDHDPLPGADDASAVREWLRSADLTEFLLELVRDCANLWRDEMEAELEARVYTPSGGESQSSDSSFHQRLEVGERARLKRARMTAPTPQTPPLLQEPSLGGPPKLKRSFSERPMSCVPSQCDSVTKEGESSQPSSSA